MTTHLTRAIPRPLRQGDRVRDTLAAGHPHPNPNYPGAHNYGTVTAGPRHVGSATLYQVRFDDHVTGWIDVRDLERL